MSVQNTPIYHVYTGRCRMPGTDRWTTITEFHAVSDKQADMMVRDGYFGLLGVNEERRASLIVEVQRV